MINLTYEQKVNIGFQFIIDSLGVFSPYGQELARDCKPYTRDEKQELKTELDNVELFIKNRDKIQQEVMKLQRTFMSIKDVKNIIANINNQTLDDVGLFELKNFLIYSEEIRLALNKIKSIIKLKNIDINNLEEALNIIDIDKQRIHTFYISELFSESLIDIRKRKKDVETKLVNAKTIEEQKKLTDERKKIVVEEDKEESKVREMLTEKLRDFASLMLDNCESIARLDFMIAKANIARMHESVKPKITDNSISFKNITNPYFISILRKSGHEFTPISIDLDPGTTCITGANMGGKSISLKTITLNTYLALNGFYCYAEKAEVPIFDNILLVSEDMQKVEQGLSSFGAEIVQLQHVVDVIDKDFSLVVLDEFSRGTNPFEGSKLCQAVVKYLNTKDSISLLVTHYDGVAELANNHFEVNGLKNMNEKDVEARIKAEGIESGVDIIAEYMNYGLYKVEEKKNPPRDAFRICKLLGLSKDIMKYVK